jgi:hypothetical protein
LDLFDSEYPEFRQHHLNFLFLFSEKPYVADNIKPALWLTYFNKAFINQPALISPGFSWLKAFDKVWRRKFAFDGVSPNSLNNAKARQQDC